MKTGSFLIRVITALIILPITLILIWAPPLNIGFSLFITGLAILGCYEYHTMTRRMGLPAETTTAMAACAAITFSAHFQNTNLTALTLTCAILIISTIHIFRIHQSLPGLATTIFALIYTGWFPAHMILLHQKNDGPGLVTLLLIAMVLTDAAAYIVGRLLGHHKLAPRVSPNKTWEGAIGGFTAAMIGMAICWTISQQWPALPHWTLTRYLAVGALLSIIGQIGDLTESILKRSAGVKDSGLAFPGHGGALDRCDSYLFAAPVLYYIVTPLMYG